jgi:ribonuclease E
MVKRMLIDATHTEETRVVVLNGSRLEEFDVETSTKRQLKGNIYLAKIVRVEPSLQAAFVDYGGGRHGFLAFNEIHPDYYQIPVADRQALLAEHRAEMRAGGGASAADFDDSDLDERPRSGSRQPAKQESRGSADASAEESGGEAEAADGGSGTEPSGGNIDEVAHSDEVETVGGAVPPGDLDESGETHHASDAGESSASGSAEGNEESASSNAESDAAHAETQSHEENAAEDAPEHGESEDGPTHRAVPASASSPEVSARVESAAEEDEEDEVAETAEAQPRRHRPLRHYKIQEVIKRRQIVLVQVVKEERGTKGAALTTYLSLAGRYCVLMPNTARGGGVSRKITSAVDRKRLKTIVNELEIPDGMAVIIRTAGSERTKPEIKRDYEYLLRLWDSVRELTLQSSAPALVYEEANLIKRSIRDLYARDIDEILVEGDEGYRLAKDFMRMLTPSHAKKVQLYKDPVPMLHRFQVETQLDAMHSPTVQLKSGGYIVINQTEALVAIDVNSGRATRERHIEETAHKTNLEAADEVARQLRLRDLAGLIVIDFIDMEESRNNHAVERRLKEAMRFDRARIQLGRISAFGLLELSRQRLRPSLMESSFQTCTHCGGTGHVRSVESSAMHVLRAIEDEGIRRSGGEIRVTVHTQVALYLLNQKRSALSDIEMRYGMRVLLSGDDSLIPPIHRIDRLKNETPPDLLARPVHMDVGRAAEVEEAEESEEAEATDESEEAEESAQPEQREPRGAHGRGGEPTGERHGEPSGRNGDDSEGSQRRRRRRRRRGRRDGVNGGPAEPQIQSTQQTQPREEREPEMGPGPAPGVAAADGEALPRRRRRGKRGGRRRNRNRDGMPPQSGSGEGFQSERFSETGEGEGGYDSHEDASSPAGHDGGDTHAAHSESHAGNHGHVDDVPSHEPPPGEPSRHHDGGARAETPVSAHPHPSPEVSRRPEPEAAAAPTVSTAEERGAAKAKPEPEPSAPAGPPRRGWWNRVL